ncbi:hypothetical protein HOLleu_00770 [Holothuria leucospilota]|uniref:Uncharacterized protein n=1 Tax=Holothuria leucospilota TaxID=206669 RepID=A0A9Q1CNF1_HOLLE|nr:hypothetical protein HOLleu_00770 [Holothuria leucospilota]
MVAKGHLGNAFSFKRHLIKQHRQLNYVVEVDPFERDELPIADRRDDSSDDGEAEVEDGGNGQDDWEEFSEEDLRERTLMLVCKLKASSSVTQSTISTVVEDVSQHFEDAVFNLQESTRKFLRNHNVDMGDESALKLMDQFEMFQKPFSGIETEYKQMQYLIASKKFVAPVEEEIILGYAPRTDALTGDVLQIPTPRVFHYVPVKQNIKAVVESPGFWECVEKHSKSTDGIITDFQDGEHCLSHPVLHGDDCNLSV